VAFLNVVDLFLVNLVVSGSWKKLVISLSVNQMCCLSGITCTQLSCTRN